MAIEKYKWKLDNGEATRMRNERVQEQKVQADVKKEEMGKNPFLKGMLKGSAKTHPQKVSQKLPAAPKDQPKTENAEKKTTQPRAEEGARGRAEDAHQVAKGRYHEFNQTILKSRPDKPQVDSKAGKKGSEKQAVTKDATRPVQKGEQGSVRTAGRGVKSAAHHAKPESGKKTGKEGRLAEQDPKGELRGGRRAKVENKNTAEGAKSDSNSASAQTKGEGAEVTQQAGTVGGGVHQTDSVDGKKDAGRQESVGSKGKKRGGAKSGKVSYTGQSGDVEAGKQAKILKTLVTGGGSDSPFDLEPQETAAQAVEYEPVEWNTGVENFTDITKSEEVRRKAIEHDQRTVKPVVEEVNYENWDLSKQAIAERFILETSQMIEYAQQIIRDARLPKDPRGFGTHC